MDRVVLHHVVSVLTVCVCDLYRRLGPFKYQHLKKSRGKKFSGEKRQNKFRTQNMFIPLTLMFFTVGPNCLLFSAKHMYSVVIVSPLGGSRSNVRKATVCVGHKSTTQISNV